MKAVVGVVTWESHLIERAKSGEQVAYELLIDMHRPMVMNVAMRMLRNVDDAKDAVQETFLKAMRALKDFDSSRPLRPWLCRICANCCVDAVRDRRREGDSLDQHEYMLDDGSMPLEERASESMVQDEVRAAIARLPIKYRKIIFMRHYRHMEVNEIAEALNKPEGTIKSWLFRARSILKKELELAHGGAVEAALQA